MCSRKGSCLGRSSFGTDEGSPEHVLQRASETTFGSWKTSLEGIPKGIKCEGSFLGVRSEEQGLAAHWPRSMGGSRKDPIPGSEPGGRSSRLPGRPWAWYAGSPVFHTLDPPGGYHTPIRNHCSSESGQPGSVGEVWSTGLVFPQEPLWKGRGNPNSEARTFQRLIRVIGEFPAPISGATRKEGRGA